MQHSRKPHSSLSANRLPFTHARHSTRDGNVGWHQQDFNVGAAAAQAVTSALANPYSQTPQSHSYTHGNYHSYFTQLQRPMTTPQGYTLSSTYVPNMRGDAFPQQSPLQSGFAPRVHAQHHPQRAFSKSLYSTTGDNKCVYDGCSFRGSKNTVEIHMMDRHLIFPPGWKKESNGWDADPSLKGKPVPIPGTGVLLDTPEALDAWIAERKKHWPSKRHVEDKKRKAQEATDRGEIDPRELTQRGRKRRNLGDSSSQEYEGRGRGRGMDRGQRTARARGHAKARGNPWRTDSGWTGKIRAADRTPSTAFDQSTDDIGTHGLLERRATASLSSNDSSSGDSTSGSDMDPVKDAVSSKINDSGSPNLEAKLEQEGQKVNADDDPPVGPATLHLPNAPHRSFQRRKLVPQSKSLHQKPFATRHSLLRKLLLPEIRHTVSNLSQAIHFLVENDFMEGVELNPGDASSQRISVLESFSFADMSSEPAKNP